MDTSKPFEPYDVTNGWTHREATHLLSRVQFGFTPAELDRTTREGMNATLQRLTEVQPESTDFSQAEAI